MNSSNIMLNEDNFYIDTGDEVTNSIGLCIRINSKDIHSVSDIPKKTIWIKQQILENQEKAEKWDKRDLEKKTILNETIVKLKREIRENKEKAEKYDSLSSYAQSLADYDRIADLEQENKQLKEKAEKLDCIEAYVRILQDGDPENEDPKKILDETARFIESEM